MIPDRAKTERIGHALGRGVDVGCSPDNGVPWPDLVSRSSIPERKVSQDMKRWIIALAAAAVALVPVVGYVAGGDAESVAYYQGKTP